MEKTKKKCYICSMSNYGTLLAVDDNPAILTALKICLGGHFERVITLSQPDNLLSVLQTEQVSAVLLDMNFSLGVDTGRDGLLWLQAILKHHPNLPVVLMTAYADIPLAVRGLKAGAADFVTKPWDNSELLQKLKDAINRKLEVRPLEELEAEHIRKAVDQCDGNLTQAAKLLGITRQTLYTKLKK